MARDFDFNRRTPKTNTKPGAPVPQPATRYRNQRKRGSWSIIFLITGLLLVGVTLFYQFNQSKTTGSTTNTPDNPTLDGIEPSQIRVGVYANGQDLTVCRDLANNISKQGYVAICIGESLASHDKTEIWAADIYRAEGEKINTAQGLNAPIQTLGTESQYHIIIYTGG